MRKENQIVNIIAQLLKIWLDHPDLRLGQLIANAVDVKYLHEIEDERLIELIERIYEIYWDRKL